MSKIMRRLKQSERAYKRIQLTPFARGFYLQETFSKPRLQLLAAIILLPPILVMAYFGYEVQQERKFQCEQPLKQVTAIQQSALDIQQSALRVKQQPQTVTLPNKELLVEYLAYPENKASQPISEFTALMVSEGATAERSVITPPSTSSSKPQAPEVKAEKVKAEKNKGEKSKNREKPKSEENEELQLDSLDLSGLSPELAMRVQNVLDESAPQKNGTTDSQNVVADLRLLDYESDFSGRLPAMDLQTHMYVKGSGTSWVKINELELYEGDWLNDQVQLLRVTPRVIIVEFQNKRIEIPALYEWKG